MGGAGRGSEVIAHVKIGIGVETSGKKVRKNAGSNRTFVGGENKDKSRVRNNKASHQIGGWKEEEFFTWDRDKGTGQETNNLLGGV